MFRGVVTDRYNQATQERNMADAQLCNDMEKKLALHLGGYQHRAKMLRQKIIETAADLEKAKMELDTARTMQIAEDAAIWSRLERLREEVHVVSRREREAQEDYRSRKEELDDLIAAAE